MTAQIDDDYKPSELDILLAGSYNLGFLAIGATPTTRTFLKWWQDRLYANCQIAFDKGMFVDQRWIDLVPGLFDGVHILRGPEYNVAYWNLHSRSVEFRNGRLTVNSQPCRFFHFSGFDPNKNYPQSQSTRLDLRSIESVTWQDSSNTTRSVVVQWLSGNQAVVLCVRLFQQ